MRVYFLDFLYYIQKNVFKISYRISSLHAVRNDADIGMNASRTELQPLPWIREAAFTRLLMKDSSLNGAPRFHRPDLWHSVHLGMGKVWVASCLLVLAKHMPTGTLDEKFSFFNQKYTAFCSAKKLDKLISRLDKHHCGPGGSAEAIGTWSKAALTSNLCMFLEHLCGGLPELVQSHETLKFIEA